MREATARPMRGPSLGGLGVPHYVQKIPCRVQTQAEGLGQAPAHAGLPNATLLVSMQGGARQRPPAPRQVPAHHHPDQQQWARVPCYSPLAVSRAVGALPGAPCQAKVALSMPRLATTGPVSYCFASKGPLG